MTGKTSNESLERLFPGTTETRIDPAQVVTDVITQGLTVGVDLLDILRSAPALMTAWGGVDMPEGFDARLKPLVKALGKVDAKGVAWIFASLLTTLSAQHRLRESLLLALDRGDEEDVRRALGYVSGEEALPGRPRGNFVSGRVE